jgi:hypothetical protein
MPPPAATPSTLCVIHLPMFGLFKKTSWTIDKEVAQFFKKLFAQLPSEFRFLQEHLQKGLYKRFSFNKGTNYFIGFDPAQSDKSMVKGRNFEIKNIKIIADGQQYPLDLTIYQGLLIGFETSKNIRDFKSYQFDTSRVQKTKSKFAADTKIEMLIKGLHSEHLDLDDLSEIEVEGNSYYQIKDLENGNFIVVDSKGQVFALMHDPFKIKLLNRSVKNFADSVNNGAFKFEEFLQH